MYFTRLYISKFYFIRVNQNLHSPSCSNFCNVLLQKCIAFKTLRVRAVHTYIGLNIQYKTFAMPENYCFRTVNNTSPQVVNWLKLTRVAITQQEIISTSGHLRSDRFFFRTEIPVSVLRGEGRRWQKVDEQFDLSILELR